MASVIDWFLAHGTDSVFDAALGATVTLFSIFVIPRRLWRLHQAHRPHELKLVISHREPEPTRTYALPLVGAGQVQAIGAITPSLVRAYGWRWRDPLDIRPGFDDIRAPDLGGNLILLGGASRNAVTRRVLEKRRDALGIRQEHGAPDVGGDRLFIRDAQGRWKAFGGMPVDGTIRPVKEDYGLILRLPNPWDEDPRKQCLVFAGVHTYGTAAAARYFVRQWWKPVWWHRHGVMAVVRVEVEDDHVVRSDLVIFRRLARAH